MLIKIAIIIGLLSMVDLLVSVSIKKFVVLSRFLFTLYPIIGCIFMVTLYFALDIQLLQGGYISVAGLGILVMAILLFFIGLGGFICGWIWNKNDAT